MPLNHLILQHTRHLAPSRYGPALVRRPIHYSPTSPQQSRSPRSNHSSNQSPRTTPGGPDRPLENLRPNRLIRAPWREKAKQLKRRDWENCYPLPPPEAARHGLYYHRTNERAGVCIFAELASLRCMLTSGFGPLLCMRVCPIMHAAVPRGSPPDVNGERGRGANG